MNPFFVREFKGRTSYVRSLGYFLIAAAGVFALWLSWFKWVNAQVDFGGELYAAWRITEGDVPVRDLFRQFGPFSDYWNALWFSVFGVSLNVLVAVNIVIWAGIVTLMYRLLRRAFGFLPAVLASVAGVMVFGCSDFTGEGNFNFIAPFTHSATHGVLLVLLLVMFWTGGFGRKAWFVWVEGVLLGLLCLTRIEFIVAGVVLASARVVEIWVREGWMRSWIYKMELFGTCAVVLLAVWGLFCTALGAGEAAEAAWTGFVSFGRGEAGRVFGEEHFLGMMAAVGIGAIGFGALGAGVWAAVRFVPKKGQWCILPLMLGVVVLAGAYVNWFKAGLVFPVVVLAGLVIWAAARRRNWTMFMVLFAGALVVLPMFAGARIDGRGFYQSMIAGCACVAMAVRYLPVLAGRGVFARRVMFVGVLALGIVGVGNIAIESEIIYRKKNQLVGAWGSEEGQDRKDAFLVTTKDFDSTGIGLWSVAKHLMERTSSSDRLVVVPEGVMTNYWLRRKSPLSVTSLMPDVYRLQKERILKEWREKMPEDVLVISRRGMKDFGVERYGQNAESGREILELIDREYVQAGSVGETVFDPVQFGARIYRLKKSLQGGQGGK